MVSAALRGCASAATSAFSALPGSRSPARTSATTLALSRPTENVRPPPRCLLAGIDHATDCQNAIVLVDVGIKEDGIASRVNDFCALWTSVTGGNTIEHPD